MSSKLAYFCQKEAKSFGIRIAFLQKFMHLWYKMQL